MRTIEEMKKILMQKDKKYELMYDFGMLDFYVLEEALGMELERFLDYVPSYDEMAFYHQERLYLARYYRVDFGLSTDLPYLRRIVDRYKKDRGEEIAGEYHYLVTFDTFLHEYPSKEYQGKPYTKEDFLDMLSKRIEHPVEKTTPYIKK